MSLIQRMRVPSFMPSNGPITVGFQSGTVFELLPKDGGNVDVQLLDVPEALQRGWEIVGETLRFQVLQAPAGSAFGASITLPDGSEGIAPFTLPDGTQVPIRDGRAAFPAWYAATARAMGWHPV